MHRTFIAMGALLLMFAGSVGATETDDLIALDKQWGESGIEGDTTVATKLLADKVRLGHRERRKGEAAAALL